MSDMEITENFVNIINTLYLRGFIKDVDGEVSNNLKQVLNLLKAERRKNKIKYEYLKLIVDLGYDYDGCEKAESLKSLIDELVDLAVKAIENDDKSAIYDDFEGSKPKNILLEDIKEDTDE